MSRLILPDRQAWRAARSTGIGASEAAAILGVSPWHSPLSLFYEKRGEGPVSQGQEFARRLGLELEDPLARLYTGETGKRFVRPAPGTFWLDQHPTKPHMLASVDGDAQSGDVDELDATGEIKTAAISKAALWRDEPPIDYIVQVQHQLACTGKDMAVLVGLIGGVSLRYAYIKRDPEFIAMLEAAIDEFWRRVQLNDPPPADGSEATSDLIKKLYPTANPSSVELPPDAIEWDIARVKYGDEIKRMEALKTEAENKLRLAIGRHAQGVIRNGIVYTLKEQGRAAHTVAASTFRVLRRVGPKAAPRPVTRPALANPNDLREEYDRTRDYENQLVDQERPWDFLDDPTAAPERKR